MILYGLIAAASPLAFAATVVVLRSNRARLNGTIFGGAFVLGGLALVLVALTAGSAAAPGPGGSQSAAAALELAFGALLLAAGWRVRSAPVRSDRERGGRTRAMLERLSRLTPAGAFSAGTLLGIGGPKRLTIGVIAGTTISAADLTTPPKSGHRGAVCGRRRRPRVGSRWSVFGRRATCASLALAGGAVAG
jgi:hypothetical protein